MPSLLSRAGLKSALRLSPHSSEGAAPIARYNADDTSGPGEAAPPENALGPAAVSATAESQTLDARTPPEVLLAEISRLREELAIKDTLFEETLRTLPAGIMVVQAPEGTPIIHNAQVEKILEQLIEAPGDIAGYRRYKAFKPDGTPYRTEDYHPYRTLHLGETVENDETHYETPQGEKRVLSVSSAPLRNSAGEIYAGVISFNDITLQHRAQLEIRQSEERYERAARAGKVGIWELDPASEEMYFNDVLLDILGYDREETPIHLPAWENLVHPEDLPGLQASYLEHVQTGSEDYESEVRLRHANGDYIWTLVRGKALRDMDGKIIRIVGSNLDISLSKAKDRALRENEERLRLGLAAGHTGTWEWDLVTDVITWSDYIYELHGVPRDQFDGTLGAYLQTVHPEDRDRLMRLTSDAVAMKGTFSLEFRVLRPDGTVRWLTTRGKVHHAHDGTPLRMVGAASDITQQRQAEMERDQLLQSERAARSEAERALRTKDEFLATLSHELRTPLNAIMGWAALLESEDLTAEMRREGVGAIARNARAQTQIIEDLLDMSRIMAGKIGLQMREIDLRDPISAAAETLAPVAQERGLTIVWQPPAREIKVKGDAGRLQQVYWNLLSNALKFSPSGQSVLVQAYCGPEGAGGQDVTATVEIRDFGRGIAPEFLPQIFERFRQHDGSSARRHGGLGLGLSLVKQLVELHGGTIEAASAGEGKGATFTVRIPQATPEVPRESATDRGETPRLAGAEGTGQENEAPLQNRNILLVDDEPDTLQVMQRLLQMAGASVTACPDVDCALEQLPRAHFDLVVSDIGMPVKDGYTFIREVRSAGAPWSSVPALAVTAFARPEEKQRALDAGFDEHLPKPVDITRLIQVAGKLLATQT